MTLSSIKQNDTDIKIGNNKDEMFSSPAFSSSANLKGRTRIAIVNARGILVSIPKIELFWSVRSKLMESKIMKDSCQPVNLKVALKPLGKLLANIGATTQLLLQNLNTRKHMRYKINVQQKGKFRMDHSK